MATKLYLPSSGTADFSPSVDAAWTVTNDASFARYPTSTAKASTTMTTLTTSGNGSAQADIVLGQWISGPLVAGQTITGSQSISIQIRCSETSNNNNLFL